MAAIAAGPHHVDGVPHAVHPHGAGQCGACGMGQLQRTFALHAQGQQEGSGLRGGELAVHEGCKGGRRHVRGEIFAPGQTFEDAIHVQRFFFGGQDGLGEVAQQAQAIRRQDGFGMELHAHPRPVIVAQGHHFAFRGAGRHGEGDGDGAVVPHHQRVITRHPQGIGQTVEEPAAVMHDIGLFAVHDAGAHLHPRPGMQAEQLMAEADAEHRYLGGQQLQKARAEAGVFRPSRPGRDTDLPQAGVTGQLEDVRVVIGQHQRLLPQRIKGLHQIVGKGIVIIDEQKHGILPRCAGQGA